MITNKKKSLTNKKTYSELISMESYEDRFSNLTLKGKVGKDTFGFDRYLNKKLYKSREWKNLRDQIIIRDGACDLGIPDREIHGRIYVHHMNPIDAKDIKDVSEYLLNPEYLITTSHETHNAIHYGNENYLNKNKVIKRYPGDTTPWKNEKENHHGKK